MCLGTEFYFSIDATNFLIKNIEADSLTYQMQQVIIGCSFNQSFYCVVCCSTDPSVPPDSSLYNVSSTRGTEVTVYLGDLTSSQMYYCKAAATNTTSANCGGPVVGGVKVFFSFSTTQNTSTTSGKPTSPGMLGLLK